MLTTSLEDLRRVERLMILLRGVAAVFAAIQVLAYDRLPWPPGFQEIGLVLTSVLVLVNLGVWLVHRRVHTLKGALRLGVATLALDTVMASAFVWLVTFDELSSIWAVLYVVGLEGALRFRVRGALGAWAVTAVLFSMREVWGSERYGYRLLWHTVSFKVGIGLLIALFAGIMAEDLVRQRMRLADAFDQLRRSDRFRSDLVSSLASDVRSPVALILAEAAAKGVGGVRARVRLFLRDRKEHCYLWPPDSPEDESFDWTATVVHQGEEVGDIAVVKPEGQTISEDDERLLTDLASQAALALRNLRLAGELEERLEELRASRERIVTAQDQERRRVERDIHDGAQQQLVALAINLGLAKALVNEDPGEAERLLEKLKADAREALETLRDLARGLFPPLLVDRGVAAALRSHVEKLGLDAEVHADSVAVTRFDNKVEAAVYFCCREAIQNASKHAPGAHVRVMLVVQDGWLGFSVADSGPGFDMVAVTGGSGLRNLSDRLEAVGGHLEWRSSPGQGTTIAGQVPAMEPAGAVAAERAGPLPAGSAL